MPESICSVWGFGRSTTYLRDFGRRKVIAVNTDKNARIFDYADYGVVADVKNIEL